MPENLLEVRDFTTTLYPDVRNRQSSVRPTNRGINLTVPAQRWVAVIGETGCGKSVFMQSILRIPLRGLSQSQQTFGRYDDRGELIQPSRVRWNFGADVVENALSPDISLDKLAAIRQRHIFYIPQNSMSSLYDYHNLSIELQRRLTLSQRQGQMNGEVNLKDVLARAPIENMKNPELTFLGYSGGMKQLTYVQMLNLVRPNLVVLDEPTTAVDVLNERLFFQHLREYTETRAFAVLLITHNIDILRSYFADEDLVYVMYKGVIVEKGPKSQVFENPIHPYTQSLVHSFPSLDRDMTITQQNLLANIRYNLENRSNLMENLTLLQTIFQFIDSLTEGHQLFTDRIDHALQNPEFGLNAILADLIQLQEACEGTGTFAGLESKTARYEFGDFLKTLQQEQVRLGDDSCPYFNQCPVREQMCLHLFRVRKDLFREDHSHEAKCISNSKKILFQSFKAERQERKTTILTIRNLSVLPTEKSGNLKQAKPGDVLLRDVAFSIREGQTVGLAGGSGQGKSTLIKTLLQFRNEYVYDENSADLTYWGVPYSELSDFPRRVQYVPQVIDGAFRPDQTAAEILLESYFKDEINAARIQDILNAKRYIAERCLIDLKMSWKALNDTPVKWSGGEKQRLLIGRALIALGLYENGPHKSGSTSDRLLILDEPTSSVDVLVQAEILNLLNEFEKRFAFSYLIVSHNLALLRNLCDIIYVIYGGEIVEKIRYDQFDLKGEPWRDMHPYTHALFADRNLRPIEPPHNEYCVYFNNCNLKGLTDEKCQYKQRIDDNLDSSIACWRAVPAQ